MNEPLAIYLHIPFCVSRCAYCDFFSSSGRNASIPAYVSALCHEITHYARHCEEHQLIDSIYFGGGTPSQLTIEQVQHILQHIHQSFQFSADCEITLEANPQDCELAYLTALKKCGVNRISLGMQSADNGELKILGRRHLFEDTIQSIRNIRAAGFCNLSLDLMFGLPDQTNKSWQNSLQAALCFAPEHISLYALSIEEGTPLAYLQDKGEITLPDEDTVSEMAHYAAHFLAQNGFEHYEISNWSKNRWLRSRHNLHYWLLDPYLGIGAGAHGLFQNQRTQNCNDLDVYLKQANQKNIKFPYQIPSEEWTFRAQMQEFVFLRLRLLQDGVNPVDFRHRFCVSINEVFGKEIQRLKQKNLLHETADGTLRIAPQAFFIANQVFCEFVDG